MNMHVWCKVKELEVTRLQLPNDVPVDVEDLKNMVLQQYPGVLQVQGPGQVHVFFRRKILRPDMAVPNESTYDDPVIFAEINKKPKFSLPMGLLVNPNKVTPPRPPKEPHFVSPEGWLEEVKLAVERQLATAGGDEERNHRVEPMAVVRCSRGGKTRFLKEIANSGVRYNGVPVPVIFISFNDVSALNKDDQEDPLQALLIRIAFAALKPQDEAANRTASELFYEFRQKNFATTTADILHWLGGSPALLLVDELNNLHELTVTNSNKATKFAEFIKQFFLTPHGRFFVFSTHILSTLESFGVFLDPSKASERCVMLQELPLVDNLSTAKSLNELLQGPREAIYYGLMPGLIHYRATTPRHSIAIKRMQAMTSYNKATSNQKREDGFVKMLQSLLDGDVNKVPELLHILLDASVSDSSQKIRWAPYHLEYVMSELKLDNPVLSALAETVASLCKQVLIESKASSGDGWEALFVLFLLARCLSSSWMEPLLPDFTPSFVGAKKPIVLYNQPFFLSSKCLDDCKSWNDLKEGILPGEEPSISIYYPTHASFGAYDAILVFSESKGIKHAIGYQLKEGRSGPTQPRESSFAKSFVLKGAPPNDSQTKSGWLIPDETTIDAFFGVSGMHWTPKKWKELAATEASNE